MPIDLRKTATDAAYIAVGAGVLGFQQAQVRRREAQERLGTIRTEARESLSTGAACLRGRASTVASGVGDVAAGLTGQAAELPGKAGELRVQVADQLSAAVSSVAVDPRPWVEPVVGDLKVRVEPVIEQVRAPLTSAVQALPEQVTSVVGAAVDAGRARVQGRPGPQAATA